VCLSDGTCCQPDTCAGKSAGIYPDGCGGTIQCSQSQ
jgi:hypothetical protein